VATFQQKAKLLQGLLTGEVAYTGPFYVTIDLTRRCNLKCLGCRFHSSYFNTPLPDHRSISDIPPRIMEELCQELKTMGANTLVLQGAGEPLLHPDILGVVAAVKTSGFHTILFTNGTLLERTLIQTFIDLKLDVIRISLWATSPEQYQQNSPGTDPDNFQRAIEGMKLVARLKAERKSKFPSVVLHFPINRNNFQDINSLVDLALATGCNGVSFTPMVNWGGALTPYVLSPGEEKSVRQSLKLLKKRIHSLSLEHNIDKTLLRYRVGRTFWQKMPCYIPWLHARITVDGAVRPCTRCDLSFGNLQNNSFHEIWNGSAIRTFRLKAIRSNKLPFLREHCDCDFCCFVGDNARVHRFFKWFLPFLRHPRSILEGRRIE
jgi:MoaA/NifB/PqqE/SkfB family radical SAM enzyme